nr:MAG TPA: hypothetical protein [Caudoviricetes sp.]
MTSGYRGRFTDGSGEPSASGYIPFFFSVAVTSGNEQKKPAV